MQFRITSAGTWDPSNDWSYQATMGRNARITLWDGANKVWGDAPGGGDTSPPSSPGTPTAGTVTSTCVSLSWSPATDNVGVVAYDVYRGTVLAGTTTTTSIQVCGLTPSTSYTFTVRARDAAGNTSPASAGVTVTTRAPEPDTVPPTVPGTPVASAITSTSATLTWPASTDNVGVVGYDIFTGGTQVGTSTTNSFNATGLTPSTTYSFTVRARDAAGNLSVVSSPGTFTTLPVGGSCDVAYVVESQWTGGFTGKVTIKNTGTSTIDGWTLRFAFPAGQGGIQGWSATWSQAGANVSAVNLDWNRVIPPGSSVQIGFNANWSGSNPEPNAFTLNNSACTIS